MTSGSMKRELPNRVMLNAYPDSIDGDLSGVVRLLDRPEFTDAFGLLYLLPSAFHSDLDRGFSIIDYDFDEELVTPADLEALDALGILLKFDLVLNHLSVGSPQFQDLLAKGDESEYADFFIDWNRFWEGEGELHEDGYVVPFEQHLDKLFMRKPGLPILQVRFPDGSDRPYWNTFYQQVDIVDGERSYLGQMDLNAESSAVWAFYRETLEKLAAVGAKILRLDAFAYLDKQVGQVNFFNEPGTWEHLARLRSVAEECGLILLPEIHSEYGTGMHEQLSRRDYPVYDFFLPGLVIDAIDSGRTAHLARWIREIAERDIATVNMLGCHDGIPVIDLRGGADGDGLLADDEIESVIERLLDRGGRVKNLYGADGTKISYYQVNATFFSALGESENRLRLARAIQLFVPGTPQVWYLDLFAGANDDEAADRAGAGGHKEINRTNLSATDVEEGLARSVVLDQLEMIRLRNTSPAFDGSFAIETTGTSRMTLSWQHDETVAVLEVDLADETFTITHTHDGNETILRSR